MKGEMLSNHIEAVSEIVPCRRQQIELLASLLAKPESPCLPCVFVYGHTATGKTTVIQAICSQVKMDLVRINCVECYSSRLMFDQILNQLSGTVPTQDNSFKNYARCDNMNDFVRHLRQCLMDQNKGETTVYLLLENAERLRDMEANLLPALARLQELSGMRICAVMETEIVWEKFRSGTGNMEPYIIHFPDYSKEELLELLCMDAPAEYGTDFYRNYCNILLSIFHLACRNLNELRHLAILNFPKYVMPIIKEEVTMDQTQKLWRNIEPQLKKALQTLYLREVSSAQWEKMQEASQDSDAIATTVSSRHQMELPFYSKYLLIASYLAAYNPAKSDKRFFTKNAGRQNKRAEITRQKKQERTSNQLLGPKPFPLDRLMAIFYSIVEGRVAPTANIYSQVSSLVAVGLVAQAASADHLDSPKYKCLVSLDFIRQVSRTVNFDVIRYLYDFV